MDFEDRIVQDSRGKKAMGAARPLIFNDQVKNVNIPFPRTKHLQHVDSARSIRYQKETG